MAKADFWKKIEKAIEGNTRCESCPYSGRCDEAPEDADRCGKFLLEVYAKEVHVNETQE